MTCVYLFNTNQGLGLDEVCDIVVSTCPQPLEYEMQRQGFKPMEHNLDEVIDIMERIEDSNSTALTKQKAHHNLEKKKKEINKHTVCCMIIVTMTQRVVLT